MLIDVPVFPLHWLDNNTSADSTSGSLKRNQIPNKSAVKDIQPHTHTPISDSLNFLHAVVAQSSKTTGKYKNITKREKNTQTIAHNLRKQR